MVLLWAFKEISAKILSLNFTNNPKFEKAVFMDKRLLIFFVSLTLTLMGVKMYFNHVDTQKYAEQMVKYEQFKKEKEAALSKEALNINNFETVTLYSDEALTTPYTTAAMHQKLLFTLKQASDAAPKTLYASVASKTLNLHLLYEQGISDSLLVYSSDKNSKVKLPAFQDLEDATLHLLSMGSGALTPSIVQLKGLKTKFSGHSSSKNALAFIQQPQGLIPAGFYLSSEDRFLPFNHLQGMEALLQKSAPQNKHVAANTPKENQKETFYLLESPYQQFVFSSTGAALVESNLKLQHSKQSPSYVKEIEVDRELALSSPDLMRFPYHKVMLPSEDGLAPFPKQKEPSAETHYPLLRRPISESQKMDPESYALNIVSKYPELAATQYEVTHFDKDKIVFVSKQHHRTITKTFRLPEKDAPYCLELDIQISGDSRNLWLNSGVPEAEIISGSPQPVLKYKTFLKDQKQVQTVSLPEANQEVSQDNLPIDWALSSNGFFGILLDPVNQNIQKIKAKQVDALSLPSRLVKYKEEYQTYNAKQFPGYQVMLPLNETVREQNFRIYAGPFSEGALSVAEKAYTDASGDNSPNYLASQSYHGWFQFISEPIVKFFLFMLKLFYDFTSSWVASILLLTFALRAILFPLNSWSMKSMRRMQLVAPEIQEIQKKYKKNPQKMQMEIMQLYKKHKVNPFSGCFPILIQMPFLIGMFDLLKTSFDLRGAAFIPGWIDNLTAPDVLFTWGFSLPIFGSELHLLPILSGLTMFIQQKISQSKMASAGQESEQQKQQKFMMNFMSIFMVIMFYNLPSGLNLYFLFSTLLGIAQQQLINKQYPVIAKNAHVTK